MRKSLIILGIGFIGLVLIIWVLVKGSGQEEDEGIEREARRAAEKMLDAMKEGNFDVAMEYVDFESVKARLSKVYEELPEEYRGKQMAEFDRRFTEENMKKQAAQQYKKGSFNYIITSVADIDNSGVVEIRVKLKEKGKESTEVVLPMKKVEGEWKSGNMIMSSQL